MVNLIASTNDGTTTTLIGTVDISLAEVLIFPQNKIQLTTKVMSILNDCDHKDRLCACDVTLSKPKHLGNLTLWFRLTCELDVLKSLYNKGEHQWGPQIDNHGHHIRQIDQTSERPTLTTAHEEQTRHQSCLHKSSEAKQACVESQANINEQSVMPNILITLTIIGLKLNNNFELPNADMTEQFYVEYSFLGTRRLKTDLKPMSTNDVIFNFTQKFPHNDRNLQRLTNMLRDLEQSIKLTVVKTKTYKTNSRSENELENESIEIGFGLLHLGKLVNEWHEGAHDNIESEIFKISVLSKQPPYQNIGCLDISMEDISSLKLLQQNSK